VGRAWPRARPAQATTRRKGHAERRRGLAVAGLVLEGSSVAAPQVSQLERWWIYRLGRLKILKMW
jgi:hypothetical protein